LISEIQSVEIEASFDYVLERERGW